MKSSVKFSVAALMVVLAASSLSFYQSNSDKKGVHERSGQKTVFVYGPKVFERSAGKPITQVEKFLVPKGVTTPFTLDVLNGFSTDRDHDWDWYRGRRDDDRDMKDRGEKSIVTSATVKLNGVVVLSPSEFNKHEIFITKPVSPKQSGTNTLEVTVEGKPGSFIFLAITGTKGSTGDTTKPQMTITSPTNGTMTKNSSITVSGTVTDQSTVTVMVNGVSTSVTNGSFTTSVSLAEGTNVITVVATDASGNQTTQKIIVIKDSTPPTLTVTQPSDGVITNNPSLAISGTVIDSTTVTLTVNGNPLAVTNGSFSTPINLTEGLNTITIVATDAAGNSTTVTRAVRLETASPVLTVTSPQDSLLTNQNTLSVTGTVTDSTQVTITVNGKTVPVVNGSFSTISLLVEGMNTIIITASNAGGNRTTVTKYIRLDTVPPKLTVIEPTDNMVTRDTIATVRGAATDSNGATVTVNGVNVPVASDTFRTTVHLAEGVNTITVAATDRAGNTTTVSRIIKLDTIAPVILTLYPLDNSVINDSTVSINGSIADSTQVTISINGNSVAVNPDGSFNISVPLVVGVNQIDISITDAAGNTFSKKLSLTRSNLPPDPATIAPKIDPTFVTTVGSATKFLYTGPHPIQTGVDTSVMSYVRAAVIRGRVLSRDNQPLPGVTVSILDHPEFGQTLSRVDGMYDMAINGGGQLTINFAMNGYLTVQRQVNTPWQSYAHVEDVALVQLDPQVTVIKLGDSISVARGSVVTDQDGTRQATLIINPGTQAAMKIVHYTYEATTSCSDVIPIKVPMDTETVLLDSLSVRATEYTVGVNGPQTMPAALPPTSAYTYCVELSADEAEAAGAQMVTFSKPIAFYIENFLNFPVGTAVPTGYYDKSAGKWIAMYDGAVLKVLSTAGGIASIDLNGDGIAETSSTLDSLGIDSLELVKLASLYISGQTLWRVSTTHFTSIDCNDGVAPDGDATGDTQNMDDPNSGDAPWSPTGCGSIIGILDQSLGQRLSITGTPFTLNYKSKHSDGFKGACILTLPLTGDTLPRGIVGVEVKVNVAGREFDSHYAPSVNLKKQFIWDGKDTYGRSVQGGQPVDVSIGYTYRAKYVQPGTRINVNFGQLTGDSHAITDSSRQYSTVWGYWHGILSASNGGHESIAGWTLDAQQTYDMNAKKVYMGDGSERDAKNLGYNIDDVQGSLGIASSWIAIAPDGAMYFSRSGGDQVWRRCIDGSIVLVAGTGDDGYSGDGGPATQATLSSPCGLAVGTDGSLYIADSWNACIRRVDPFGIITTCAGTGTEGFSGDGGPAVNAMLSSPIGIAVGPDGSLFIADADSNRIRMVNPAGIITTVAGNGIADFNGDGGLSLNAELNYPTGVDVDGMGNIYVADYDNMRVRKITPQGIITTVAGNGDPNYWTSSGDGGPAADASLSYPMSVTVGKDGTVFIDESGDIRRIGADGIISTFLNRSRLYGGSCNASAFGPDGVFYCSETGSCCSDLYPRNKSPLMASLAPWDGCDGCGMSIIHRVRPAFPGVSVTENIIASENGREVYVFDLNGKHLRTLDALTGARLYSFTYDSLGLLAGVTDRDSLVTTIQRNESGVPIEIISPYGQRTILNVDAKGYLTSVIDPAGDTTRFTYTTDGLMTSLKNARGNTHSFAYDSLGRLAYDRDPAGGYKILTRSDSSSAYFVTVTTPLGGKSIYEVSTIPTDGQMMKTTDANGLTTTTTFANDGTYSTTTPDGTVTQTILGPDPRFGMQSPVTKQRIVTTPNGVQSVTREDREISEMAGLQIGQLTDNVTINGYRTYQTVYDGQQRLLTSTSPEGRQSFTYTDTLGRVVKDSIFGIIPVNYSYDSKGKLASLVQGARISYFSYDSLGKMFLAKDPIGNTSGFAYDSVGRITTRVLSDGKVMTFAYDANGNLITLTPPGRSKHIFDYNVNDLTDHYTPPFAGDSLRSTNYFYDLDKRLTTMNLPDGRNITITYDTAGCGCGGTADRIHSIDFDRGTQIFAYDTTGNLSLSVTPERDTLHYVYDGSLPYSTYLSGVVNGNVHYYIDGNYWLNALQLNYTGTDSPNNIIGYDYDGDGLLIGIYQPTDEWWDTDNAHYLTISRDYQTGKIASTSLGDVNTSQSYDGYGALSNYEADYGSTPMFQTTYSRDSLGRITSLYETEFGVSKDLQYCYDAIGRLEKVWRNDTLVSQYVYDANGNRVAHITPTQVDSGMYDAQDRMLVYDGAHYFYSRNGDLQAKISPNGTGGIDTTKYAYDAFGNLTQVVMPDGSVIEYVINGQNRRIAKKVNGRIVNKWLYAGQLTPVAELDSADNVVARFSGGYMNKRDTIYQIITDHLGSPRLVVDVNTGVVMQRMDYDEFGNVIYDSNPGFQPFGFAGGLYDPETRLTRFGARDYDASVGRWTSRDPLLFAGGVSNLYEYCVEDPLNWFDGNGGQFTGLSEAVATWFATSSQNARNWLANALGYQPDKGQSEAQAEDGSSCPIAPTQQQMDQLQLQALNNFLYAEGMGSFAGLGAVLSAVTLGQLGDWGLLLTGGRVGIIIAQDYSNGSDYSNVIPPMAIGVGSNVSGVPVSPLLLGAQGGAALYMYIFPPPPPLKIK